MSFIFGVQSSEYPRDEDVSSVIAKNNPKAAFEDYHQRRLRLLPFQALSSRRCLECFQPNTKKSSFLPAKLASLQPSGNDFIEPCLCYCIYFVSKLFSTSVKSCHPQLSGWRGSTIMLSSNGLLFASHIAPPNLTLMLFQYHSTASTVRFLRFSLIVHTSQTCLIHHPLI